VRSQAILGTVPTPLPVTPKEKELLQTRVTRQARDLREIGIHVADEQKTSVAR